MVILIHTIYYDLHRDEIKSCNHLTGSHVYHHYGFLVSYKLHFYLRYTHICYTINLFQNPCYFSLYYLIACTISIYNIDSSGLRLSIHENTW